MADPRPQDVALWISDQASNTEFKSLRNVIFETLSTKLISKSIEEISELSEHIEPFIVHELDAITNQNLTDGITARFIVTLEGSTTHFKILDRPEIILLNQLQKGSPIEFEHFCKRILDSLGAKAIVEGGPYDQGVDFTGFELPLSRFGPAPSGAFAVVIGQAKRYATGNNITEKDVREFIGSATRRAFLLKRTYASKVGSLQPIVFAFWTTSDFHPLAKAYAREMGIWYLGGLALTQLALRLDVA
ncbi:MAG: restriction endonuclease [bacterium]